MVAKFLIPVKGQEGTNGKEIHTHDGDAGQAQGARAQTGGTRTNGRRGAKRYFPL